MTLCVMLTLLLSGCVSEAGSQKTVHDGTAANAVILNFSEDLNAITVKDADSKGIFGESCMLDCTDASVVYCDDETGEVWSISLSDLSQGDEVIVYISASEIQKAKEGTAKISQLQLSTQRMKQ